MTLRGNTQTLTAVFYDQPGGAVEDPLTVSLSIYLAGVLVHGPIAPPALVHDGPGLYRYEYAVPIDATPGTYSVAWTSQQPGDAGVSVGYDNFEVTTTVPFVPDFGGCDWPMDPACQTEEWQSFDDETRIRSLHMASATLHRLSGGRVTNCPITVRPQPEAGFCGYWTPYSPIGGGYWATQVVRTPGLPYDPPGVALPRPVGRILEVKVDGQVIPSTDYHVQENVLVWHGVGPSPFPGRQDLTRADSETDTFAVTYLNGYPVDSLGAYAVGLLAIEFAKACTGKGKCRLPDSVTTIVRQGVTMEITPGSFANGVTGIREVDAWIGLWNPRHLKQATTVHTPDQRNAVVR